MKKMSTTRGFRDSALLLATLVGIATGQSQVSAEAAPTLPDSPIRLSSNENAFGFTPKAKEAMIKYLDGGSYYNRNNVTDLIDAVAEKEGVPADYVVVTPGSGPVLMMTALAYAELGVNVVTTEMGYTQLIRKFAERGGEVKFAPLADDMGYDFEAMAALIDENTKIVYICNPNNPTGVLADAVALKQFVLSISSDILVFIDEAYLELADSSFAFNTCASLVRVKENILVTRTFSKGHGMAGFRIGYAIANPKILEKMMPYYMGSPSYLASIAAIEAIKDDAFLSKNIKLYQSVRRYVCDEFDKMGIAYAKPQGAFVYFKSGMDEEEIQTTMEANGVLITGSRASGVPEGSYSDWARVSIGTKEQMDKFLSVLKATLANS